MSTGICEGFITVQGGKVWYRIVGADKKGVPLLVLHGGPGANHDYLEPLEALADERLVVFYDQLGCGNADKPKDKSLWTLERAVDELSAVREALKLDQVHILGQSWGSMLVVDYMLSRKPKGVKSLILSGPCLSVSRWAADQRAYLAEMPQEVRDAVAQAEASGDFASFKYQGAMMRYYQRHICRLDPWPECLLRSFSKINMDVYGTMWGPSEFTVTGTLKSYERAERLKEIAVPALFTAGRWDEAAPRTVEYYRDSLPGSEMVIFEDASHIHHLEQKERYLAGVRGFLGKNE